jgi:hypothetical protein
MSADKPPNTTRLYYANVNGLAYGPRGGDFAEACCTVKKAHIDLLGIGETKLDTKWRNVAASCVKAARRVFSFSRVVLSRQKTNQRATPIHLH